MLSKILTYLFRPPFPLTSAALSGRPARSFPGGVVLAAAVLSLYSSVGATADYPPVGVDVSVDRLGDTDAYFIPGIAGVPRDENEGFTSNAGFIVTETGVVAFDALGTPSLGDEMVERIRETTQRPIRYVVASHYHADHIYGLQAFQQQTDAIVVAQRQALTYVASEGARQRLTQRRDALAPWVNENTHLVPPEVTFTDELSLRLGDKRFRLIYAGPAHSPSDLMMMVEPAGVLFAGDIVQNHRIPSLDSDRVNTDQWLAALEKVRAMEPDVIVPGHGEPSDKAVEAIKFTRDYIRYLRETMGRAVKNWQPFDEAYAAADWSRYKDLPAFDATNKRNAYRVKLELEEETLK